MTSSNSTTTTQVVKRLYILAAFLFIGFSMIWLLPKSGEMKLSRLKRHLPMEFGSMRGTPEAVTGKELQILAKDTEFERAQYINVADRSHPPVEVSIVFSGKDLNNSIHRPERCLKAQGWNFEVERKIVVKGAMPDGSDMPFKEIVCSKPVKLEDGRELTIRRVQYYTFFGHSVVVEGHYARTFQDMKDRLLKGYDQQWAYATFSIPVTKAYADQGLLRSGIPAYDVKQSEAILADFIQKLAPLVVKP